MCYPRGNSEGHIGVTRPDAMQISILDRKLRDASEDEVKCRRTYGAEMAKKIRTRVAELCAAESLADFWPPKSGPERCHELKADLAGTFSVDVKHPYRMLFKATTDPSKSEFPNERDRWAAIKSIEILRIEDTHG